MSEQKYCVVATFNGVRRAITGPMTKERAEAWCKMESEIMTQRNVVKALNDDNVRLRKKLKNKEYEHQS